MDRETVVSSLFESVSKEKRVRDPNVVQTLKGRQNPQVRGEKLAQQRLYEAEADVEVKRWEKRNSDIALDETHEELESQRLQVQQANQWANKLVWRIGNVE